MCKFVALLQWDVLFSICCVDSYSVFCVYDAASCDAILLITLRVGVFVCLFICGMLTCHKYRQRQMDRQ